MSQICQMPGKGKGSSRKAKGCSRAQESDGTQHIPGVSTDRLRWGTEAINWEDDTRWWRHLRCWTSPQANEETSTTLFQLRQSYGSLPPPHSHPPWVLSPNYFSRKLGTLLILASLPSFIQCTPASAHLTSLAYLHLSTSLCPHPLPCQNYHHLCWNCQLFPCLHLHLPVVSSYTGARDIFKNIFWPGHYVTLIKTHLLSK